MGLTDHSEDQTARDDRGLLERLAAEVRARQAELNEDTAALRYVCRLPAPPATQANAAAETSDTPTEILASPPVGARLDAVDRRRFLQWIVTTACSGQLAADVELDKQQIDMLRRVMNQAIGDTVAGQASIADWDQTVLSHGRATRDRPSSLMLSDLATDLAELSHALTACRSSAARRDLTRVVAQMAGLMCLTFVKLDDRDAFRRWARTARLAAMKAGDTVTHSWVRSQEAYGHYYADDLANAIAVAQDAQALAGASPCVGAALAAALEARAHAAMGRQMETRTALGRAEGIVSHLAQDLEPSALGYNEAQLRFHESSALTHLGDIRRAWEAQERSLVLTAPYDYTDRALTHLDRATCLVQEGDFAEAVAHALRTFSELTDAQRTGIITLRARGILATLPRDVLSLPVARDLFEITHEKTGGGR
jgi:hypothetical protein